MNKFAYTFSSSRDFSGQKSWLSRNWFQLFLFGLAVHLTLSKDIRISFGLHSMRNATAASGLVIEPEPLEEDVPPARPASYTGEGRELKGGAFSSEGIIKESRKYPNLTFILSPTYARRKGVAPEVVREKRQILEGYINRYLAVAQAEKRTYGIPVSITLAQGLLESDAGESRLAKESNNHFGIKCRSKCRGCTCRNYSDDDLYDMFRVFTSPRESYREHSLLLNGGRYRHLLELDPLDYKGWAHGLKKAGYATDKRYAHKLIRIIETLRLDRYDR